MSPLKTSHPSSPLWALLWLWFAVAVLPVAAVALAPVAAVAVAGCGYGHRGLPPLSQKMGAGLTFPSETQRALNPGRAAGRV